MRLAIGNGLRPDIWKEFVTRFGIAEVGEFYGATEGNIAFFNHYHTGDDAAQGAIGHTGWLFRKFQGWKITKFNVVEEEPVRGPDGFCVECDSMEPGELIAPIEVGNPMRDFVGYVRLPFALFEPGYIVVLRVACDFALPFYPAILVVSRHVLQFRCRCNCVGTTAIKKPQRAKSCATCL